MGGEDREGREQVRSSPCIKLKAGVLLQLSCLTTALDRCAEQEWCHHCLCKLSFEEKQKALPGTRHRSGSPQAGPCPCSRQVPRCSSDPGDPEPSCGDRMGHGGAVPGAQPGQDSVPPVPRLAQGRAWEQQAPSQLLFSSASLGTFPVVTARTLEGLPEPKHSRRRSPPPPDIDSPGGSRS